MILRDINGREIEVTLATGYEDAVIETAVYADTGMYVSNEVVEYLYYEYAAELDMQAWENMFEKLEQDSLEE